MKVVNIEFTWRGETFNHFIPHDEFMRDIMYNEKYIGTIGFCKYKIDFNNGVVYIYANGNKEPFDKVDNFVLRFSERY